MWCIWKLRSSHFGPNSYRAKAGGLSTLGRTLIHTRALWMATRHKKNKRTGRHILKIVYLQQRLHNPFNTGCNLTSEPNLIPALYSKLAYTAQHCLLQNVCQVNPIYVPCQHVGLMWGSHVHAHTHILLRVQSKVCSTAPQLDVTTEVIRANGVERVGVQAVWETSLIAGNYLHSWRVTKSLTFITW